MASRTEFDALVVASAGVAAPATLALFLDADPPDEAWLRAIARDEKDIRLLALLPDGAGWRPVPWTAQGAQVPDAAAQAAASVAADARAGRPVMGPAPAATTVLSSAALERRIRADNVGTMRALVEQLSSPLGVIPLVGAGLSAAIRFGEPPDRFPQWGELLNDLASGSSIAREVAQLVEQGRYERAAAVVDAHHPDALPQRIHGAFARSVDPAQLTRGVLALLPLLVDGPVITTNFDRVLEEAFEAAGRRFAEVVAGPQAHRLTRAIHRNERALLKIHGDCSDPIFRVLTEAEYEKSYGGGSTEGAESIGKLAWLMFSNRPLLCLGCSLEKDRTTQVLRALKAQLDGIEHYAVLADRHVVLAAERRRRELGAMGVRPLWYAPGRFEAIEALLREALERSSTRAVAAAAAPAPLPVPDATRAVAAFQAAGREFPPDGSAGPPATLVDQIVRTLLDGRLTFFLGAYAHLRQLPLGNDFYADLAREFECPELGGDRAAVADQVIRRRGSDALWQHVKSVVGRPGLVPGPVYRLLASLPALLRGAGHARAAPLWVFTTNLDGLIERALADAGEPVHLLYQLGSMRARDAGRFAERLPDGSVRVIERPTNIRSIDPAANVVVKLNGGLFPGKAIEESALVAAGHFERLATDIPACLPAWLRSALQERALLFLGHGLKEPDVAALIRAAAPADRTQKSWAIQLPPDAPWRAAWEDRVRQHEAFGLRVVEADLECFLAAFRDRLAQRLQP